MESTRRHSNVYLVCLWNICVAYVEYEKTCHPGLYSDPEWRAIYHLSQILRKKRA